MPWQFSFSRRRLLTRSPLRSHALTTLTASERPIASRRFMPNAMPVSADDESRRIWTHFEDRRWLHFASLIAADRSPHLASKVFGSFSYILCTFMYAFRLIFVLSVCCCYGVSINDDDDDDDKTASHNTPFTCLLTYSTVSFWRFYICGSKRVQFCYLILGTVCIQHQHCYIKMMMMMMMISYLASLLMSKMMSDVDKTSINVRHVTRYTLKVNVSMRRFDYTAYRQPVRLCEHEHSKYTENTLRYTHLKQIV